MVWYQPTNVLPLFCTFVVQNNRSWFIRPYISIRIYPRTKGMPIPLLYLFSNPYVYLMYLFKYTVWFFWNITKLKCGKLSPNSTTISKLILGRLTIFGTGFTCIISRDQHWHCYCIWKYVLLCSFECLIYEKYPNKGIPNVKRLIPGGNIVYINGIYMQPKRGDIYAQFPKYLGSVSHL